MKRTPIPKLRKTGRPLSFDREEALQKATLVFWKHGYEASSLSQLTAAMGITSPSLYTAFGDKKRLFLEAVARYADGPDGGAAIIGRAGTAKQAVEAFLEAGVVGYTQHRKPTGCLLLSGATNCSAESRDVQKTLIRLRLKVEKELRKKIASGLETNELPPNTDADALAAFYMSVAHGMSTQAQDGAKRETLRAIARTAMHAWPSPSDSNY